MPTIAQYTAKFSGQYANKYIKILFLMKLINQNEGLHIRSLILISLNKIDFSLNKGKVLSICKALQ